MSKLSVIIPSKTTANLKACINAVRECEKDCQIIVIDDGLDLSFLPRPDWMPCDFVKGEKPFVFARNCNIGIRLAGEDDVVLLNDDALLTTKGGFSLLQREAEVHKEYGCIGAVTNVTGQILQRPQKIGLRPVHHIAFVCVLIPRRTLNTVGLLDERYCIDYGVEDRDYCEMVRLAEMKVGVHDGCYVDHSKLVSSFRGHPMAPGRSTQNRKLFLDKFGLNDYFKF